MYIQISCSCLGFLLPPSQVKLRGDSIPYWRRKWYELHAQHHCSCSIWLSIQHLFFIVEKSLKFEEYIFLYMTVIVFCMAKPSHPQPGHSPEVICETNRSCAWQSLPTSYLIRIICCPSSVPFAWAFDFTLKGKQPTNLFIPLPYHDTLIPHHKLPR